MGERNRQVFTPEMIEKMAYIWMRSSISLIDVRHQFIEPMQPLLKYKMPGSMLIYAYGGTAHVHLNEAAFAMERFGLFHGGKGTLTSVVPDETTIGSYSVLYKAETPTFFKRDLKGLLEQVNPFVQQFGYAPSNPVALIHLFDQMMGSWGRANSLNHFQAKNLFFQSVHEIYRDLEQEEATFLQPDPVILAKRYLDEYYKEPIMFQELAGMFSISNGQLTRLFKKKEGKSLQEYAIQKRLDDALLQLANTNASVKEIALGCGFADESNFFRIFKKHYKYTPNEYRKIKQQSMHEFTIDNDYQYLYNGKGLEHLVKSQRDGEFNMFGQARSKQMILAAAMSLMLLLSACTSGTTANHGGNSSATPSPTQAIQQTSSSEPKGAEAVAQTRVVQTEMGDVEIPVAPTRIIAPYIQGDLLALGIKPVGSSFNDDAVFEEEIGDTSIGIPWELDLEAVMALEPDLIIYPNADDYEKLSLIAPTVIINDLYRNRDFERILKIGDLVGQKEKAEELYANLKESIGQSKERLEKAGLMEKTVVLMEWNGGDRGMNILGDNYGRGGELLYAHLGMKAPQRVLDDIINVDDIAYMDMSLEVIADYQGDFIFTGDATVAALTGNPIWDNLTAVKDGKVIIVNEGMFWFNDVLSVNAQLELITNELLKHAAQ